MEIGMKDPMVERLGEKGTDQVVGQG